jgi:predicted PurR-regulated permease PerM
MIIRKNVDSGLLLFGFLLGTIFIIAAIFAANVIPIIFKTEETVVSFNQSQITIIENIKHILNEVKNNSEESKQQSTLNVQMTKINSQNIKNIMNNISEMNNNKHH